MGSVRSIEQALLGSVLTFGATRWQMATDTGLVADDFAGIPERALAAALARIVGRGEDIELVVVEAELGEDIAMLGGLSGLSKYVTHASASSIDTLARRVLSEAARRRTRAWHLEQAEQIGSGDLDDAETWDEHQARARGEFATLSDLGQLRDEAEQAVPVAERAFRRMVAVAKGEIIGVPTGLAALDEMCGGRGPEPGDLVVGAGRPGSGKTAFALSMTRECLLRRVGGSPWAWECKEEPTPVLWANGEMPNTQLLGRMWADVGSFDGRQMRSPSRGWMQNHSARLLAITEMMQRSPLAFVADSASNRLDRIIATARKWRAKMGTSQPGLVVIDYLQRMEMPGLSKNANREQQVNQMAIAAKNLAKELDVVVLLLAQLNRDCERRPDKRPMMSDLRESGGIEQEADLILGYYRDSVYNDNARETDAEVIVMKNRHGPLGMVRAQFVGRHFRFCEVEADEDARW